jgi:hypothetical protein
MVLVAVFALKGEMHEQVRKARAIHKGEHKSNKKRVLQVE